MIGLWFLLGSGGVHNEGRECGHHSSEVKVIRSAHTATAAAAGVWAIV
jgi:hypothetical protein